MYIRFVSARPHPRVEAEAGMWDAYWRLRRQFDPQFEDVLGRRIRHVPEKRTLRRKWLALLDAAEPFRRLRCPESRGPARVRGGRRALFWFKPAAGWAAVGRGPGTVILDARALAGQMARWGIEIREITIRDPGTVLWQDDDQVLAIPRGRVPRAFRTAGSR